MVKFRFSFPNWRGFVKWMLITWAVLLIVGYGWQFLEFMIEGEIKEQPTDTIIGIILVASILLNLVFIDSIVLAVKRSIEMQSNMTVISQEQFDAIVNNKQVAEKKAFDYYQDLSIILGNCRILDKLVSETIINEEGGESSTEKFSTILSFAKHIKLMNDANIAYINDITSVKTKVTIDTASKSL